MPQIEELTSHLKELSHKKEYQQMLDLLPADLLETSNNATLYAWAGDAYNGLKDYPKALALVQKAIATDPNNYLGYFIYGDYLYHQGKFHEAIELYNKSLQIFPENELVYNSRGATYFSLNDLTAAKADFVKAIAINTGYADAYYNLGNIAEKQLQYQDALDYYNQALQFESDDVEFLIARGGVLSQLGQKDDAITNFENTKTLYPNEPRAFDHLGVIYHDKGDMVKAIDYYTMAIAADKNYSNAYINRASAYVRLDKLQLAIDDYSTAINLDPKNAEVYNYRGVIYDRLKDYDKAIADYAEAIKLNPKHPDARINSALAWDKTGNTERAIMAYTEALVQNPSDYEVLNYRGVLWDKMKDFDKALADYTAAITINPNFWQAYKNRAFANDKKGDSVAAIADYDFLIKQNPTDAELHNYKAVAQDRLGKYEEAIATYSTAIDLRPDYYIAYANRGYAYEALKNYDAALTDYDSAIIIDNKRPEAFIYKGLILAYRGQFADALENYRKASSFDTTRFPSLKEYIAQAEEKLSETESMFLLMPKETVQKKQQLETRIFRLAEEIRDATRSNVKAVVHYTKLFVADIYVKDINSRMHYSNAIYMNDPMEGNVLFDYFNYDKIKEAYQNAERRIESTVYLGSFLPASEELEGITHEDELVMWRTYGKDENGKEAAGCNVVLHSDFFSSPAGTEKKQTNIGNTSNVESVVDPDNKHEKKTLADKNQMLSNKSGSAVTQHLAGLLNVIYIRKIQDTQGRFVNDKDGKIEASLSELKDHITHLLQLKNEAIDNKVFANAIDDVIFNNLSKITYLFKSADYQYENEVRIIRHLNRDEDLIRSMNVNETGKPPKRFYIESENNILPFIKRIYLGPKVENHQQWSLYFDYELRQRKKELEKMPDRPYNINPSAIKILRSENKFQ